ncbi:MAG: 50S ribosomal protein L31 [Firmicutes bacterium]|jgi:large subunit ribosomal protein L31|nr:50S ribosomal protein L31 [Bacillota bacterium]
MQANIHPKYGKSVVTCACGATFETRSTKPQIRVEVCSECHPFYTGQRQTVTQTGGRVERFLEKYNLKK